MKRLFLFLALWNAYVFGLYAYDKWAARTGRTRIRETTLIGCAFAFGAPGAILAMRLLRHKTRKLGFTLLVPLGLLFSVAIVALFVVR